MTKFFNTRVLTAALAAGVTLAAAAAANAAAVTYDPDTDTAAVSTADLNLSSASDARLLVVRLHTAAKAVCGDEPSKVDIPMHRAYEACLSSAYNGGVAQVNNAMVTAMSTEQGYPVTVADRR